MEGLFFAEANKRDVLVGCSLSLHLTFAVASQLGAVMCIQCARPASVVLQIQ
jgi:hypothetical protein